ncbi:cyclic GMP-AMP synthase-like isoform X1 [Schistocerca americana]|uniref:cyclic GMP-AMP synthase-like isoform X1 n=1 Tax=Schistocerca americana TaxID=7009 RepID=UPI001F4F5A9D|nr:cyclic GMP-AMP synthase-like isoform X1 [Schistocerca americana]
MATSKYHKLEVSIHKILQGGVTLDEEETKKCNKHLEEIFLLLEYEMKKNPTFAALFRPKQYVGSFYENLKIDMPNEFDIDFELWLPSWIGELQVSESEQPGFCLLKLLENMSPISDPRKAEVKKQVKKWTDTEGFLLRCKVNEWMQSIVYKAINEYEKTNDEKMYKFTPSCHGPAVTLTVTHIEHPELCLSLDFVPVFVFEKWPTIENLRKWEPEMEEHKWYAVPKSSDYGTDFRICFWHQEKHLLLDTNQMKPVLKLIKKLRDIRKWKGISSYCIKTMFLWKTHANGKKYWQKSLGKTFIEMLNDLKNYLLDRKCLPFFWVEENDLLSKLNSDEKNNIGGYLKNMVDEIEKNLDVDGFLERYFNLPDRTEDQNHEPLPATLQSSNGGSFDTWNQGVTTRATYQGRVSNADVTEANRGGYVTPIVRHPSHSMPYQHLGVTTRAAYQGHVSDADVTEVYSGGYVTPVVRHPSHSIQYQNLRLPSSEEESGDETNWDMPVVSRSVNHNSQLHTRQQEDNTGTIAAIAVGVGAAALVGVGLLAHILGDNRRARE